MVLRAQREAAARGVAAVAGLFGVGGFVVRIVVAVVSVVAMIIVACFAATADGIAFRIAKQSSNDQSIVQGTMRQGHS